MDLDCSIQLGLTGCPETHLVAFEIPWGMLRGLQLEASWNSKVSSGCYLALKILYFCSPNIRNILNGTSFLPKTKSATYMLMQMI